MKSIAIASTIIFIVAIITVAGFKSYQAIATIQNSQLQALELILSGK